jgi:hypothetical protein
MHPAVALLLLAVLLLPGVLPTLVQLLLRLLKLLHRIPPVFLPNLL